MNVLSSQEYMRQENWLCCSDDSLPPIWNQYIIHTNARLFFNRHMGRNFSDIFIEIPILLVKNAFENVFSKMSAIESQSQCVKRKTQQDLATLHAT